jgi:hypothetical protein
MEAWSSEPRLDARAIERTLKRTAATLLAAAL